MFYYFHKALVIKKRQGLALPFLQLTTQKTKRALYTLATPFIIGYFYAATLIFKSVISPAFHYSVSHCVKLH